MIDDFNRKGLAIEVDFSLPAERVMCGLDLVIEWRGKPAALGYDNGPEYVSNALNQWSEKRGIQLDFNQLGSLQKNAYVERYNRTVRYEWQSQYLFESVEQVQTYATRWLWTYNNEQPNMAFGRSVPHRSWLWWPSSTSEISDMGDYRTVRLISGSLVERLSSTSI